MLGKNPRGIVKTREKLSLIMSEYSCMNTHEILPAMLNFPQAPWVLHPGEAQCEPKSLFSTSRALGWHTLTLSNISPLLFSLYLKEIQQCKEPLWGTAIKGHFKNLAEGNLQGKEISDGAGSLGHSDPTHSASGGVGTVWIKGTCNFWKDSINSSGGPHRFVKWWHRWVTGDLCPVFTEVSALSHPQCPGSPYRGRGAHSQDLHPEIFLFNQI